MFSKSNYSSDAKNLLLEKNNGCNNFFKTLIFFLKVMKYMQIKGCKLCVKQICNRMSIISGVKKV